MARRPKRIVVPDQVTWSSIFTLGSKIVTAIIGLSAAVAAWLYLGFWRPASYAEMMHEFTTYDGKVKPRIVEAQALGLQNRLEILNLNRQSIERERTDLEIKQRTVKDPSAQSIITDRMRKIDNDARATDKQISDTQDAIKTAR